MSRRTLFDVHLLGGRVQFEAASHEDYLDGYSRGPYRWLLDVYLFGLHVVVGVQGRH